MKIEIKRVNQAAHFEASAPSSPVTVQIDGPASIGGEEKGVRPMELVLMALGSCSVFDLGVILKKQRQEVKDIKVSVSGERREEVPQIFTDIHITFDIWGDIDQAKAEKAAELAVKKYCSVHDMLVAGGINITYSLKIHA